MTVDQPKIEEALAMTGITGIELVSPSDAPDEVIAAVKKLLLEVDGEFVPPLSARSDTLSVVPGARSGRPSMSAYFAAMSLETWLVATRGSEVVALLSFVSLTNEPVLARWSPSLYATTLAVSQIARGSGITKELYRAFELVALDRAIPYLTIRTWTASANAEAVRRQGFDQVVTIPDDRAPGIGTIYFARPVGSA